MPRKGLSEEIKEKIVTMYKKGISHKEISNLIGVSIGSISKTIKEQVESGTLTPKRNGSFGKTKVHWGKGKYIKKGYNPNRKLNQEQENELLNDYFIKNMTYKQVMAKYNVWQTTIKRIVDNAVKLGLYERKGKGYIPKVKRYVENEKGEWNLWWH